MAEFIITTCIDEKGGHAEISISDNAEFADWMIACELLLKKTAQLSSAGYERALELLCQGSMDFKMTEERWKDDDYDS